MGNLSLVFHVASLVVLVGLTIWVLRLQVMLKLWRDWGSPVSKHKVTVGEPLRVLRQFACAIGATFDSKVSPGALPPCRVRLTDLFNLHRQAFIDRIEVDGGDQPCVCFVLESEPSTIEADADNLSRALGGTLRVEIRVLPRQ